MQLNKICYYGAILVCLGMFTVQVQRSIPLSVISSFLPSQGTELHVTNNVYGATSTPGCVTITILIMEMSPGKFLRYYCINESVHRYPL